MSDDTRSAGFPRVTVIIPTHDHAATVDLAIESVLGQTVTDLDVVVIGDGATSETSQKVRGMLNDRRVRFLERPKSLSRAEDARHEILETARSRFVCYLGDDDLMLPDHVETMIRLLDEADFAHPLPVIIDRDGALLAHPTDLARSECVEWHLSPNHNSVSLTGAAHRVESYLRIPSGWRTPPRGRWSDHFMWEQWFQTPGMRFVTGSRLTVLKLDSSVRQDMSPLERREEMLLWRARITESDFADELARLASDAFRRFAVQARLDLAALERRVETVEHQIHAMANDRDVMLAHLADELQTTISDRDAALADLAATRATLTWRAHDGIIKRPGVARLVRGLRAMRRERHDHPPKGTCLS